VASRAAILASLLPEDVDREKFMHILGIHGDPVASRRRIDLARRQGERFEGEAYDYKRAFTYLPQSEELEWLRYEINRIGLRDTTLLDPTAGGGSVPYEAIRLGLAAVANDLNPVASLILRATVEFPLTLGLEVLHIFRVLAERFIRLREERLAAFFPAEPLENAIPTNYLWARTLTCPYCEGIIPLSPTWQLASDGTGVRLLQHMESGKRYCTFEIVMSTKLQSPGTVARGGAICPYPDCERVVDYDEVRRQAQAGRIGEQLYAVIYRKRTITTTKTGRKREKWVRNYRTPRPTDDVSTLVAGHLTEKLPEWEALNIVPTESIGPQHPKYSLDRYGILNWRDVFSQRQLLCHSTSVEIFRQLLDEENMKGSLSALTNAAFGYLSIAIDKFLNYNARFCRWDITTGRVRSVFDRHDFGFCWSYAEMAPLITGLGYDWTIEQTAKCIGELVDLVRPDIDVKAASKYGTQGDLLAARSFSPPPVIVTCRSADNLEYLEDESVDVIVMDPPYYDNVMYAELSDFFYVWLKRTAGYVYPELFRRPLTDKENEAVANPSKFHGMRGAKALAAQDYRERMAAIFAECRRVLKSDGIMTLMFTHKATGAWDALTTGLMEAGFVITASWPINTEAEGSLHIKDKSAANSTIFLVCRPRPAQANDAETLYWEDLEPRVSAAVRQRIHTFQEAGIRGVDLYLSCFGPALEEFSRHWPVKRGQPRPLTATRRRQKDTAAETSDPYAATPEDALDAARREVKRWRLEQLTTVSRQATLDPLTEWFVLAWDAFGAPQFPYDEALRLARVVGIDMDHEIIGHLAQKKASGVLLWDSSTRAAKGALGPPDGSRAMLDAVHHAAHTARTRTLDAAHDLLVRAGVDQEPTFLTALEAVLEVLPPSRTFTGIDLADAVAPAASDFEALESLRRLAFTAQIDEPEQLRLWKDAAV
jgi:putative DNA methylase